MSWSSQPSEDVKSGLEIPSVVFRAQQPQAQNQASLARSVSNGSNAFVSRGPVQIRPSFGHGGGGGSIDIMAAVRLMELERQQQQQQQLQIQQEQRKTSEASMNVYQDQLPAFIARLKELGLSGPGGMDLGFVPQGPRNRPAAASEVSSDWFGTLRSGVGAFGRSGSQVSGLAVRNGAGDQTGGSNYSSVSPIEQQQQQGSWQTQLPGINKALEKNPGGGKEQVFELNGDSVDRKRNTEQGSDLSGTQQGTRANSGAGYSGAAPRWKDPLAWAREQRLKYH